MRQCKTAATYVAAATGRGTTRVPQRHLLPGLCPWLCRYTKAGLSSLVASNNMAVITIANGDGALTIEKPSR